MPKINQNHRASEVACVTKGLRSGFLPHQPSTSGGLTPLYLHALGEADRTEKSVFVLGDLKATGKQQS